MDGSTQYLVLGMWKISVGRDGGGGGGGGRGGEGREGGREGVELYRQGREGGRESRIREGEGGRE